MSQRTGTPRAASVGASGADELLRLAQEVVAWYEATIGSVEELVGATQEALERARRQRDGTTLEVRDALARAASLRKRDFNTMMAGILSCQAAREQAVGDMLRGYLREQGALARELREALRTRSPDRNVVLTQLRRMRVRRQEGERNVVASLTALREEQTALVSALRGILSNGDRVTVKRFKAAVRAVATARGPDVART